jgi:hypothetical protein
MNMARSMLSYKKLSNEYWAEAVACSVYLLNRSPTVSIKNLVSGSGRSMEWHQNWCRTSQNFWKCRFCTCSRRFAKEAG